MFSANEIRQQFIDFFVQKHGHTFVPSSGVVPVDDPTLLFTNAGMNQFKPIFLGLEKRAYSRAVNTQKCIRAGGKHNDLDDVGKDTYHHTFFEMLGNWSFGDYFKKEAITWAWELLTVVWKLDPERLHVTVFEGDPANNIPRDDEAANYWRAVGVKDSHIHLGNKKDNFWEMGSTGPCGPCTEIHYDATPDKSGAKLVNQSSDKVVEIWNNVFIQFNRNEDQSLTPLPAQHVDTGMGFERIVKVLQGKSSNYDTDVFTPLMVAIQAVTKAAPYGGVLEDRKDTAYRVIADHIRTLTFSITDGGQPSNDGRGSVIRSILRRAARYGMQCLNQKEPFLYRLVSTVVDNFSVAFPELKLREQHVVKIIHDEEKSFHKTLAFGVQRFNDCIKTALIKKIESNSDLKLVNAKTNDYLHQTWFVVFQKQNGALIESTFDLKSESSIKKIKEEHNLADNLTVDAVTAFQLHTSFGLFIDIVEHMSNEIGFRVDRVGYDNQMLDFRNQTGEGRKTIVISAIKGELPKTDDTPKYVGDEISAKVLGWVKDNTVVNSGSLSVGDEVGLLLDRTSLYGEQGGQAGDSGVIQAGEFTFDVEDTKRLGDAVLHLGIVSSGSVSVGETVQVLPSTDRVDIMRNHTATHMMNLSLREELGEHVEQKGSLVDAEKLRFDFSHDKPLTADEIAAIEAQVNRDIRDQLPVSAKVMPLAEAKKLPGVRAVFGEKYPDPVRVVAIGTNDPATAMDGMSIEFCGGTHLSNTAQAGFFKIVSQENVSKGVRRITAVTGRKAFEHVQHMSNILGDLASKLHCTPDELGKRVDTLQEEVKKLQKQIQKGSTTDLNTLGDQLVEKAADVAGVKVVIGEVPSITVEVARTQIDRLRQKAGTAIIVLGWKNDDGTAGLIVGVSEDVIKRGIKSNDVLKPLAEVIGGKGGGPPHMATAGGKDASQLTAALTKARELVTGLLTK